MCRAIYNSNGGGYHTRVCRQYFLYNIFYISTFYNTFQLAIKEKIDLLGKILATIATKRGVIDFLLPLFFIIGIFFCCTCLISKHINHKFISPYQDRRHHLFDVVPLINQLFFLFLNNGNSFTFDYED